MMVYLVHLRPELRGLCDATCYITLIHQIEILYDLRYLGSSAFSSSSWTTGVGGVYVW